MINAIKEGWGWCGAEPQEILAVNKFGNVIFTDRRGRYWRLVPEDLECKVIAESRSQYVVLRIQDDFILDWNMTALVGQAEDRYGKQPDGRCFCLKVPGPLGGAYDISNIGTISVSELIRASGDIAEQIKDLPDGEHVRFVITE